MMSAFEQPQTRPPTPSPFFRPAGWDERQQPTNYRQFVPGGELKSSKAAFSDPYLQTRPHRDVSAQLRTLQQHYTIVDSDRDIIGVLEDYPALFALLAEAVKALQNAFGKNRLLQVRVQHSDDDKLLKVAVLLPADFACPELALRSFDTGWWIDNCQRSSGALVFDCEIQDAV